MNGLLTVKQVLERLKQLGMKRSPWAVYNWIQKGLLPAIRPSGHEFLIKEDDLNRFLGESGSARADAGETEGKSKENG